MAGAPCAIDGFAARGFECVRDVFVENFNRRHEAGGACCITSAARRSSTCGAGSETRDRGAVEAGHDGDRLLGHEGTGGDDAGGRALPRLARLRRARGCVLAGVRAARQRTHHRASAAGASGGTVCAGRAGRSAVSSPIPIGWPPCWRARSRRGNRGRAGLSRDHARFLRERAAAPVDPRHRSLGRFFQDEIASPLGLDVYIRLPEEIPNHAWRRSRGPAHRDGARLPAAADARGDQPAVQHRPRLRVDPSCP